MYLTVFYLLRSKQDGRYLAARDGAGEAVKAYVLLFKADHEALTYLSTHSPQARDRFTVESINNRQLADLIQRWGFSGMALVEDPIDPSLRFIRMA